MRTLVGAICVGLSLTAAFVRASHEGSPPSKAWFQKTEQSLMDAVATGRAEVWDAVLDDRWIMTSEEGELLERAPFLKGLRPLPDGLQGGITVKELSLDEYPGFAVVRYLADEWETVFGQRLVTKYRATDTFRKTDSGWKMTASHVSVVTADPPAQPVSTAGFPALAGTYQLLPNGWTFYVTLRDGELYGGRDRNALKRLIPMTPTAFVREGTLGEWLFVLDGHGKTTKIVNLRKFEPLVWTRIAAE